MKMFARLSLVALVFSLSLVSENLFAGGTGDAGTSASENYTVDYAFEETPLSLLNADVSKLGIGYIGLIDDVIANALGSVKVAGSIRLQGKFTEAQLENLLGFKVFALTVTEDGRTLATFHDATLLQLLKAKKNPEVLGLSNPRPVRPAVK